jgi:hypothetical protein
MNRYNEIKVAKVCWKNKKWLYLKWKNPYHNMKKNLLMPFLKKTPKRNLRNLTSWSC